MSRALKEAVARLIRMTTQKTAGQRMVRNHLDWNQLETVTMTILCAATRLCLDGQFGEMPELIEEDPE